MHIVLLRDHLGPILGSAVDTWATVAVAVGTLGAVDAIPVSWDGKWSGKTAMWDHLRVEPPRTVR